MSEVYNCKLGGPCAKEKCELIKPWQQCGYLVRATESVSVPKKGGRRTTYIVCFATILLSIVLLMLSILPLTLDLVTTAIAFNIIVQTCIILVLLKIWKTTKKGE